MKRFLDNCKKLQKRAKKGQKMLILGYFDILDIFCPFLLILNQTKNSIFQQQKNENLKNLKNLAQKCRF